MGCVHELAGLKMEICSLHQTSVRVCTVLFGVGFEPQNILNQLFWFGLDFQDD